MGDQAGPPSVPEPEFPPENDGNKLGWWIALVVVAVAIVVVVLAVAGIRYWVGVHTGVLRGGPDPNYNFWSGFGSDLGEATLISAVAIGVYTGVRKANCHTKGCWRIGHHPLEGTPYILCRHHHPGVPNEGATHQHILKVHHAHTQAKSAQKQSGP